MQPAFLDFRNIPLWASALVIFAAMIAAHESGHLLRQRLPTSPSTWRPSRMVMRSAHVPPRILRILAITVSQQPMLDLQRSVGLPN